MIYMGHGRLHEPMSSACAVNGRCNRTAIITPVPKYTPVTRLGDFSPILVSSFLSRVVECLVVKDHIFRAIPLDQLPDQLGLKPIGSITAALVDSVALIFEDNTYV